MDNVVAITAFKGGVGKTTISSQLAGMAAETGYRVLTLDLDPQANLRMDFGIPTSKGDKGESLFDAMTRGQALKVIKDVRPGLDAVPGGEMVENVPRMAWDSLDRDPLTCLRDVVEPLAEEYDLVVIDTPPSDRFLREAALATARFAVVPTRTDPASIEGVTRLAQDFQRVRAVNPDLELLGVVIFGVMSSATALKRRIREEVARDLGDVAPVFEAIPRYTEASAVAARVEGLLVHEYARDVVDAAPSWWEELRAGRTPKRVASSAHTLAGDYVALAAEILQEMHARMGVRA